MNCRIERLHPFGLVIQANNPHHDIREIEVEALRELFGREQLLVLRGFKTFEGSEQFSEYCERWGEISVWPFGRVLELVEQDNPKDHIFDNNYVPLHWDGMYRPQVPEYQIFHCMRAPSSGQGGRTTFSNTILALKNAAFESIALWKKVTGHYQRKMEFYNSKTMSPIITKHPFKDISVIRYNEPPCVKKGNFINPPDLKFTGLGQEDLNRFHQSLKEALYSPTNFYAHEWQTGDVVIADNFSLLHGREEFESKCARHLQRVHVLSNPPLNNPHLKAYQ